MPQRWGGETGPWEAAQNDTEMGAREAMNLLLGLHSLYDLSERKSKLEGGEIFDSFLFIYLIFRPLSQEIRVSYTKVNEHK